VHDLHLHPHLPGVPVTHTDYLHPCHSLNSGYNSIAIDSVAGYNSGYNSIVINSEADYNKIAINSVGIVTRL
jgi:hypothetical protein